MHFVPEIEVPAGWETVRIATIGVPRNEVLELKAQIRDLSLSMSEETGVIFVRRNGDDFDIQSFE